MHRLLVSCDVLESDRPTLPPGASRHLKVVRPRPSEVIELFDGAGHARLYRCGATASAPLEAAGELQGFAPSPFRLTLFACITKGSRWDWTIEKSTELGVTRIVPVISDRCIVRIDRRERAAKRDRWQRIAEDAARQSDAKWLPEICEAMDFGVALDVAGECRCFAGALTKPPSPPLLVAVRECMAEHPDARSFGLFVGPEGDFTPQELETLLRVARPASFGSTILRAETAAIYGVSVLAAAIAGLK